MNVERFQKVHFQTLCSPLVLPASRLEFALSVFCAKCMILLSRIFFTTISQKRYTTPRKIWLYLVVKGNNKK